MRPVIATPLARQGALLARKGALLAPPRHVAPRREEPGAPDTARAD
jgi:hypothetical protein